MYYYLLVDQSALSRIYLLCTLGDCGPVPVIITILHVPLLSFPRPLSSALVFSIFAHACGMLPLELNRNTHSEVILALTFGRSATGPLCFASSLR